MDISHETLDANIVVIRLNGRLDAKSSTHVKAALEKLLQEEQFKIIVDMQRVSFIDSSGLAALVSGLRSARERKGDIVLSGVQSQAQTVFRLTMLDRVFAIHPTFEQAKHSLT